SALSHLRAPEPADVGALSGLGRSLDARSGHCRGRVSAEPRLSRPGPLPVPDRRGCRGDGGQLSWRALSRPVEDYASVLVRTQSGVLGTIEVGNTFPRDGTDGQWKIAGRDAILALSDGTLRLTTAKGEETESGEPREPLALTSLRDALDHFRRGARPPISVHDC